MKLCIASRACSAVFHHLSAVHKDVYQEASSSSATLQDDLMNKDKPIKFSTSDAGKHHAYDSFFPKTNAPWYQVYIVSASVAVFLLYFTILREENDVDVMMSKTIWESVPQLRIQDLQRQIEERKELGTDVSELEEELEELLKKYK